MAPLKIEKILQSRLLWFFAWLAPLVLFTALSASHALDQGDFVNFRIHAQRLWELHPEWRTVILTNAHEPFLNLRFPPGAPITPLRDSDSLKTVWETKAPFVGNLSYGYVAIRVPVIRDGRMMYTLVAPTDPDFFRIPLQRSEKTGDWDFMVVGSDGIVISASGQAPSSQGEAFGSMLPSRQGRYPGLVRYAVFRSGYGKPRQLAGDCIRIGKIS